MADKMADAAEALLRDATRMGTEIGLHAANEALSTMMRIIEPLPTDAHRAIALGTTIAIVQAKIDGLRDMGSAPADLMLRATFDTVYKQQTEANAGMLEAMRTGGAAGGIAYAKAHGIPVPDGI
jgi:hypothetical protein